MANFLFSKEMSPSFLIFSLCNLSIRDPLYKGYELIIEGTVGSVLLFDEPKLSGDEINQLYDKGKLPLDYNGNLVLPYCES